MRKIFERLLIIGVTVFYGTSVKGEIISIQSMKEVEEKMQTLLEKRDAHDLLVAFDVDMTLIQPDHPAVYYPALKQYHKTYKAIMSKMPEDQKDLPNVLALDLPSRLVEEEIPEIVKNLQKQGVKTIAFTASLTGKIGKHSRFEVERYRRLKNFSLSFEHSFSKHSDISLKTCSSHRGNHPIFYKGILSANGEHGKTTKGGVLVAFLDHVKFSPKIIVVVDDRKSNLENIEKALRKYDPEIIFVGMEYQGAFTYEPETISAENFKMFWEALVEKAQALPL